MHLAVKLPPELGEKLGRFNHDKDALKQELLKTVEEVDRLAEKKRAARFADLVSRQAPDIGALEELADEIRHGMAAMRAAPPPWLPPIPPALAEWVANYKRDRIALAADLDTALENARVQTIRPWDIAFSLPVGLRERELVGRQKKAIADRGKVAAEFESKNADRIDRLGDAFDKIEAEAGKIAQNLMDPQTGRPMTAATLLRAHNSTVQRFDTIGREEAMYARYKTAMLQPGLSPGQRRLLFIAAQINLSQALPGGEDLTRSISRPRPQSVIAPN